MKVVRKSVVAMKCLIPIILICCLHGHLTAGEPPTTVPHPTTLPAPRELARLEETSGGIVCFSRDGSRILTTNGSGMMSQAQVWDARTYKPIGEVLEHGENLRRAEFDATATKLLTVGHSRKDEKDVAEDAKLWDVRTGKLLFAFRHGNLPLTDAALSPDGKTVATCNENDFTIRLWNAATGKQTGTLVHKTTLDVDSVQFDSSGSTLVTSGQFFVALWDVPTSKLRATLADFRPESVPAISADGKRIAFADFYFFVVYDLITAKKLYEIHPQLHLDQNIAGLSINADGTRVAMTSMAGKDGGAVWDLATGAPLLEVADALTGIPALSPDGTKVVFDPLDPPHLWDVSSRRPFKLSDDFRIYTAAFSPDGKRLAMAGTRYTAILEIDGK